MDDQFGTERSPETARSVSETVVERVAEALDESPTTLDPPLNDVIDPEALDRIFATRAAGTGEAEARLTFVFAGCRVVVDGSGAVEVTPRDEGSTTG